LKTPSALKRMQLSRSPRNPLRLHATNPIAVLEVSGTCHIHKCITLYAALNRNAFDDADRRMGGHDARETKTRPAQQGAVLLFRTLLSTRHHKHGDVQQLNRVW